MKALRVAALCLSLLLLAEAGLRVTGRGPWRPFEDLETLPTLSAPDPALGWTNLPGTHQYRRGAELVRISIDAGGSRGPCPGEGSPVVLLGGSYVFGFGLDDADTLGAQLQRDRPDLAVCNRAVPGYGTVQSLLVAEGLDLAGAQVVYGFVELHEGRNVAARSWRRALERSSRNQAWARVPSAVWDGRQLQLAPPVGYRHWALSERVALIDAAERAWNGLADRFLRTKAETTVQLMLRLRQTVEGRGGRLLVALLDLPARRAFYEGRLREAGVAVLPLGVDGVLPDGHPDAATQERWAAALAEVL